MGLREQAAIDSQAILEDDSGFAWPLTLTNPAGVSTPCKGFSTDVGQAIDPETGQAVAGRRASVAVSLRSLAEMPVAVADAKKKPWLVAFASVLGVMGLFKVVEVLPDRAMGVVVLLLEAYQTAVTLTGALLLPGLLVSGSVTPLVPEVTGAVELPGLELSGSVSPVVDLSGTLELPGLELSGSLAALEVTGNILLPGLDLDGSVTTFDAAALGAIVGQLMDPGHTATVVTGSGVSSLADALGGLPAVCAIDAGRPPRLIMPNGERVIQSINDFLALPRSAANNQLRTWWWAGFIALDNLVATKPLLRYGITNTNSAQPTDSHEISVLTNESIQFRSFTDASGGQVRTASSSQGVLTNTAFVFMTAEHNGDILAEPDRCVLSFDAVLDSLQFFNSVGTPGAWPTDLQGQPPTTNIAMLNFRSDANLTPGLCKAGLEYFGFAAAPGATRGCLTDEIRFNLANFRRPML